MSNNSTEIVAALAASLVEDVHKHIKAQVVDSVRNEIAKIDIPQTVILIANDLANNFSRSLKDQVIADVAQRATKIDIDGAITEAAKTQTVELFHTVEDQLIKQVHADIDRKLSQIDVGQMVKSFVDSALKDAISEISFPDGSIPASALNLKDFAIQGNHISGGIVEHFGSTGIQDSATFCQVTIMDEATVIENKIVASEIEVKGNLTVDGDIILTGEIPTDSPFYKDLVEHAAGLLKLSMTDEFFASYAAQVFDIIKRDGLDLSKLTLDGNPILKGNQLGYSITETNIQKLGELRNLTVHGDSSMAKSLFARNKRVGINTEEPAASLSIWDEECEILVRKLRKDVSIVGSNRPQQVLLSSNAKENLTLEIDGSVSIPHLRVGTVEITSSSSIPMHDAKPGVIVLNDKPEVGKAAYWVSLGGARWGSVGIIS